MYIVELARGGVLQAVLERRQTRAAGRLCTAGGRSHDVVLRLIRLPRRPA